MNVPVNVVADKATKQAAKLPEADAQPNPVSCSVTRAVKKTNLRKRILFFGLLQSIILYQIIKA